MQPTLALMIPLHETRAVKNQHRTITQEAILACMNTYNYIKSHSLTPANTALCLFPLKIHNAVLGMDTSELLEMWHSLVNPKYREFWGKSCTTELNRLAQGIPGISKGINTIAFIARDEIPKESQQRTAVETEAAVVTEGAGDHDKHVQNITWSMYYFEHHQGEQW
jgi:hypothetical protein